MQKTPLYLTLTFFVFILTCTLLSITFVNAQTTGNSWPMFCGDLSHSGRSSSTVPLTNQTLWIKVTDGQIRSSIALVDNVLYTGAFGGYVYAFDAVTGNTLWSIKTGGDVWCSPAVSNGLVYIGSNDFSFYALDAETGNTLWSFETGGGVWSSPAVVGNVVYVGSTDNRFYAFNAQTGAELWSYTTGGQIRSSPIVVDNVVYFVSQDGYFYALDAGTGSMLWRSLTNEGDTYTNSSPAYNGGVVYIGSTDGNIYAFDAGTGSTVWNYQTNDGKVSSSPAITEGLLYIGSEGGTFYCLNAQSGNVVWSKDLGSAIYAPPTLADGKVLIGTWAGELYVLNAQTGDVVWTYNTDGSVFAPMVAVNGAVFVGAYDDNLYAFGQYNPTAVSETPTPPPSNTVPTTTSPTTNTKLTTTVWTPQPTNAFVAPTVAFVGTAVASVVVAASTAQGVPTDKLVKEFQKVLPSGVKSWLSSFVASKRKLKVEEKTGSVFKPTKPELLVYVLAIAFMTVSFAYVKVEQLADIFIVLPTFFATSILVAFSKTFISIVYSRHKGVWTEYKLWYFGIALFLITTFALKTPFSKPARSVSYSPKYTAKIGASIAVMSILLSLAFAGMFLTLIAGGFVLIGSAGLAMCIIDALFDTFPVAPMNGKMIFKVSKKVWLLLFLTTLSIYIAWLLLA